METLAKHVRLCDNCKTPFKAGDEDRDLRIKATLASDKGQNQNFDFCDESCLLGFLKKRAKRRMSKACLLDPIFNIK